MLVLPFCSETIGNLLNDSPIGLTVSQRLKYLVQSLDSPFRAREGALFFETWTGRQDYVGKMARGAEEDVLHDEKVQLREPFADKIRVGIHQAHLFAKQVHRLELAFIDCFDHLVVIQSLC